MSRQLVGRQHDGEVLVMDVKNPDHFKVVKVGSKLQFWYREAVAVAVKKAKQ